MNGCDAVRTKLNEYLDGTLNGSQMRQVAFHIDSCAGCEQEWKSLQQSQELLARLGPVPEPKDLLLRIKVAVSQERARSRRTVLSVWSLVWQNTVGPFLLQAAAGLASAVVLLGGVILLITMFAQPEVAQAKGDEPLGMATGPRLLYLSDGSGNHEIGAALPVVVEAYVNGAGEVYDFRIIAGPDDSETRAQVEEMLLMSRFEPARFFGQPVRGLAVISFAGISVRG